MRTVGTGSLLWRSIDSNGPWIYIGEAASFLIGESAGGQFVLGPRRDVDVYRIGWCASRNLPICRRLHRPWQAEAADASLPFARRALTAAGARRKILRDLRVSRAGRQSTYQRYRSWRKRWTRRIRSLLRLR